MRDRLRLDEGSAPEGYTVAELSVLARSAVAAQRVAALRILEAVIRQAKPCHWDVLADGALAPRPVAWPEGLEGSGDLDWSQVSLA